MKRLAYKDWLIRLIWLAGLALAMPSALLARVVTECSPMACSEPVFLSNVREADWVNIDVQPAQGTAGIKAALNQAQAMYADRPVRIRLAAGLYADNLGAEIFAQRLFRSVSTPIWLIAADSTPNATRLEHGINLLGVSYLAIEGVTIGPPEVGAWNATTHSHAAPQPLQASAGIHVAGAALLADQNANNAGTLNSNIYGKFEPSHHILVRNVTIQNLFELDAESGELSIGQGLDGMKFNQVEQLWVLNSRVRQTSRHGIDNVGVHNALFAGNVIANSGGGQGIEAKGGSTDVTVERNTFYRVRRVALGGENTDAAYYFSSDNRYDYEALRFVLRNNLIIDAREAALDFAGCTDCSALGNSILFSAQYQVPVDDGTVFGGDAIRVHDSMVLGASEGAGSDCQFWNGSDYVTVNPCWGVGSNAPAPVGRVLRSANLTIKNNLFASINGHFGNALGGSTAPCPLNVIDGSAQLAFDGNYWYNGSNPLPANGCSNISEGSRSVYSLTNALAAPGVGANQGLVLDASSFDKLAASAFAALTPSASSTLLGRGLLLEAQGTLDQNGQARPALPAIGALEAQAASVVTVSGNRASYTVRHDASGYSLVDGNGNVRNLGAVTRIRFADQVLAFDTDGAAGKGYRVYQAAFNRTPDLAGLGFWIGALDRQVSLQQVAAGFIDSAEFIAIYGNNPGNEAFVTRLYNNVLHREPEPGGYAFWVNALGAGVTRAQVLAEFSESAENKSGVAAAISNGISYLP
ncbi:MAG: hypothetical protein RL748_3976 [Pseudomonadota bacterium]